MSNNKNNNNTGGGLGCAFVLLMAVFAMPLVGLYLALAGEEKQSRMLGVVLTIVGIIVWVKIGVAT